MRLILKVLRDDFVEDGLFFEDTEDRNDGSGLAVFEGGVGVIDGVPVMLEVCEMPPGLGVVETDGFIMGKTPTTPGPKNDVPGTRRVSSLPTASMALTNVDCIAFERSAVVF